MDSALDLCAKKPAPLDRQSRAASDRAQPEHQSSKTEFAMAENVLPQNPSGHYNPKLPYGLRVESGAEEPTSAVGQEALRL
jgi:hypothetical protein